MMEKKINIPPLNGERKNFNIWYVNFLQKINFQGKEILF